MRDRVPNVFTPPTPHLLPEPSRSTVVDHVLLTRHLPTHNIFQPLSNQRCIGEATHSHCRQPVTARRQSGITNPQDEVLYHDHIRTPLNGQRSHPDTHFSLSPPPSTIHLTHQQPPVEQNTYPRMHPWIDSHDTRNSSRFHRYTPSIPSSNSSTQITCLTCAYKPTTKSRTPRLRERSLTHTGPTWTSSHGHSPWRAHSREGELQAPLQSTSRMCELTLTRGRTPRTTQSRNHPPSGSFHDPRVPLSPAPTRPLDSMAWRSPRDSGRARTRPTGSSHAQISA